MNNPLPMAKTPFSQPTTQHLLTCVAAIGAAVVLPTLLPATMPGAALLAGAAGAVGGLGQNLISGFIQRFFDRRENDPSYPGI